MMTSEENIEVATLNFMQNIQKVLKSSRNSRLGAYYRWHQQNILDHIDSKLALTSSSSGSESAAPTITTTTTTANIARQRWANVLVAADSLCTNCLTPFKHLRVVPKKQKKLLSKKNKIKGFKRGKNYKETFINAKCHNCLSRFKFKGLQNQDLKSKQNNLNSTKTRTFKRSQSETPNNSKNSFPTSTSAPKSQSQKPSSGLITPRVPGLSKKSSNNSSQKAFLQKLLGDSKKKKKKDSTGLGDFLSNCFN